MLFSILSYTCHAFFFNARLFVFVFVSSSFFWGGGGAGSCMCMYAFIGARIFKLAHFESTCFINMCVIRSNFPSHCLEHRFIAGKDCI